jgi:hypothetical protein
MTDEITTPVTETAVLTAGTDVRKEAENAAKTHINTIWQSIESWSHEKIEALIADLKKHV